MERELTVRDGEYERSITGIEHAEWDGMGTPCPGCGSREYRHFETAGGRYGVRQGALVRRSDYWGTARNLYTQCLECDDVLYKHPAFDLLFSNPESAGGDTLDF